MRFPRVDAIDSDSKGRVRLERFRQYIEARLTDPEFALADIGRQFRVSDRYVRRVFARGGETPSQYLKRRRLELAFQKLADQRCHQTILAIAIDCGFSGAAYFSRCFRRRFDTVPSAVRKHYSVQVARVGRGSRHWKAGG